MSASTQKHVTQIIGKIYEQMLTAVREPDDKLEKNIILYVGEVYGHMIDAIKAYQKKSKKPLRIALIHDAQAEFPDKVERILNRIDIMIPCDLDSHTSVQEALKPLQDELLVVSSRAESAIPLLAKVIPEVPYLHTPTSESLKWASNKIAMRERLRTYNPDISPLFTVVHDDGKQSIKKIEDEVGFPLVVKPSGLAASRLVSICFHKEELEDVLKRTFRTIEKVHKENNYVGEPNVLVEQFMEGEMYSQDLYVDGVGHIYSCPISHIKTGKTIGFDDFFGYQQMTPATLNDQNVMLANMTAMQATKALALRNTTVHVELMNTQAGWKIIELGARMGGFRHMMYDYSYGFSHVMNDLLIRMGEKPQLAKKLKGYTVAMKFFAKEEGSLERLTGIKKIQELTSFKKIYIHKQIGDMCLFAKNGGGSVFDLVMFHKDRSALLADIRRVEKTISIEIKSKNGKNAAN